MADTIVNERIKEIIDVVFKGNITSMARASFISRTTLSSIIDGKMVTPESLRKWAKKPYFTDTMIKTTATGAQELGQLNANKCY